MDQAIIGIPSFGMIHTTGNSQLHEYKDIVRTFENSGQVDEFSLGLCTIRGQIYG